jgi:hypothetical protein
VRVHGGGPAGFSVERIGEEAWKRPVDFPSAPWLGPLEESESAQSALSGRQIEDIDACPCWPVRAVRPCGGGRPVRRVTLMCSVHPCSRFDEDRRAGR